MVLLKVFKPVGSKPSRETSAKAATPTAITTSTKLNPELFLETIRLLVFSETKAGG